jgi:hypothetical protein
MKARKTAAVIGVLLLAGVTVACGSDDDGGSAGADVCPAKLKIQTDWFPELEHGGTYQLIGPNGTANKDTVSYSGPVLEQYAVGGLKEIEIGTIKFDKQNSAQLADGTADMAYIGIADVIKDSAAIKMVSIMKTLDKDPQMVMWDPAQYDIKKPEDIAASGAPVLHFPGTAYTDYMTGKGYMTKDQDDPSYDGSDAKWVASKGSVIQQGFATNEVYKYENEIQWKDGKPADVSFYTVGDLGFDNYPAALTMMQDKAAAMSDCLKLLVPKMAQAWVDFYKDPKPVMDKMIEINKTHDGFWGLSAELNDAGFKILEEKQIGANSPDGTYCSLDDAKVKAMYDLLKPIYDAQGVPLADDYKVTFDNQYCKGAPGR